MDSGSPAFFCALNDKTKEVLISVRGTASAEDVFMDVLATGECSCFRRHNLWPI